MAIMTQLEKRAKRLIRRILNEGGYPTYANIFNEFDLNLTSDPSVVGYMRPGKGLIVVNKGLDESQISVIVRHEILHEYLNHTTRLLRKLGAKSDNINDYFDGVDGLSIKDLENMGYDSYRGNVAGDLEISNLGYTEEDKATVRAIKLNGKELSGLVTEDDHPEWVTYSLEELYDALEAEKKKIQDYGTPIEVEGDDDDQDDSQNDTQSKDWVDEVWVYGSYDENTGEFLDEKGNVVDYVDDVPPGLTEAKVGTTYVYCDKSTGNIYKKKDGQYVLVGNVNGPTPPKGDGPPPEIGKRPVNQPIKKNKNK